MPDQSGHTEFPARQELNPGFHGMVFGAEGCVVHACPGSHAFVSYAIAMKKRLANLVVDEEVHDPPFSLFVGLGNLQHASCRRRGAYSSCHHTYFILEDYKLKDVAAFSFGPRSALHGFVVLDTAVAARPRSTTRQKKAHLAAPDRMDALREADALTAAHIEDWYTKQ